jgi:hypothetical protein
LATPAAILNLRLARVNIARSRNESSFETTSGYFLSLLNFAIVSCGGVLKKLFIPTMRISGQERIAVESLVQNGTEKIPLENSYLAVHYCQISFFTNNHDKTT